MSTSDDGHGAPAAPLPSGAATAHLLRVLLRDPEVPRGPKLAVLAASALTVVPPSAPRALGRVLGVGLLGLGVRGLVVAAGYDRVRREWRGGDDSFVWLMLLTGVDA